MRSGPARTGLAASVLVLAAAPVWAQVGPAAGRFRAGAGAAAAASAAPGTTQGPAASNRTGGPGLKLLAGGVALFPDPVLEKVLEASQNPAAVTRAVQTLDAPGGAAAPGARMPDSVAYLAQNYPDTLRTMAQQPGLTARLGREFQANPQAVWSAIGGARSQIESGQGNAAEGLSAEEANHQATMRSLATPEALQDLAPDAALSAEQVAAAPATAPVAVPGGGGTVVAGGGPTVVAGAGAYPYSAGFYADGAGGYVRRGWYGHDAFGGAAAVDASTANNFNRRDLNPGADRRRTEDGNRRDNPADRRGQVPGERGQASPPTSHSSRYDHADPGHVSTANRSMSRSYGSVGHGGAEHKGGTEHKSGAERKGGGDRKGGGAGKKR